MWSVLSPLRQRARGRRTTSGYRALLFEGKALTQRIRQPWRTAASPMEYDVMYALRGADEETLAVLREKLSDFGHSVVIVGNQAVAQVDVHLVGVGAAVEAALGRGVISRLRINALPRPADVDGEVRAGDQRSDLLLVGVE